MSTKSLERAATERVPRDQRDWPTIALAMALDAGILTGDDDYKLSAAASNTHGR